MREKSLVRKLVRYFTKYVRKHKVRRRNPKYKKYVRFFSTAFSTPFSVLASKANIKRRKRHKFRIKGSRLTAVFKKYRSLKGIETLQRQLRLSEKKINLSSGSKVFKYTKKSLHAKFINSTTTALKISNALLYQNKINKELLHLNSSSRRHVRSFKPYYKSKRFR
ncbi:MAG: hypothetical protein ACXWRG_11470 [Bdellovibrio sp.]